MDFLHHHQYFDQRIVASHVLPVPANFPFVLEDNLNAFILEGSNPSRYRVSFQDILSACVFAWISNH
jgi:hypothetical protein